jgi:uncharacterized membrane protein
VFFLLTGASASLTLRRMPKAKLSRFLVSRGAWLIFLKIVVMCFALQFNLDYHVTMLIVLWALGWAMVALAALIWLPAVNCVWVFAVFSLYPLCRWYANVRRGHDWWWLSYL